MQTLEQERAADSDTVDELSRDDIFEVLSNRRRRYTLHYLKGNGDAATLGGVAEQVAAWENETAVEDVTADQRKRVYTSLQQFHLPKLDDQDVVEFDERSGRIELTAAADDLDVYVEVVGEHDIPWSHCYLGLAATGAGFAGLSALEVSPFAAVPDSGWLSFVLVSLGVLALVHAVVARRSRLGARGPPPEVR